MQPRLAEKMQVVRRSLRIHAYICVQAIPGQAVAIGENSQCVLDDGVWEIVPEAVEGVLHSYVSQTHSPQVPMHAVHPGPQLPSESCPCLNRLGLKAIYRYY